MVTYVCETWRTIALESPELWFDISFGYTLPWLKAILKRSKGQVALDVLVPRGSLGPPSMPTFRTVLSHPSRLRSLELNIHFGQVKGIRTALSKMVSQAPLLEKLSLANESLRDEAGFVLPAKIFDAHTPNLRTVHLGNCALESWDVPLLSGLTHLRLRHLLPCSNYTLPGCFLGALRRMPRLQELVMICYPFRVGEEEDAIVHLPHLRALEIITWNGEEPDDQTLTRLLRRIQIPPTTRLDLNTRMSASSVIGFAKALRTVLAGDPTTENTAGAAGATLTSLDMFLDYRYLAVELKGLTAAADQEASCLLGLTTDCPSTAILRTLLGNLPIDGLRSISIYAVMGEICLTGDEFTSMRFLDRLQTLKLSGSGIKLFLKPPEIPNGDGPLSFHYPALERLLIACVDVPTELDGILHNDEGECDVDRLMALIAGCRRSEEEGASVLKEVSIRRCDVDPQDLRRLEEACGPALLLLPPYIG